MYGFIIAMSYVATFLPLAALAAMSFLQWRARARWRHWKTSIKRADGMKQAHRRFARFAPLAAGFALLFLRRSVHGRSVALALSLSRQNPADF